ncbi:crotonase/enoyl-CoA hydratase family protein [Frankia sp. Mgl5]|uniref:crotonase/enoyl-CoA hydratase family protein n=1 Tax=Frankia sp. Mgl5 TaxID=2933793 RepID=UPI00200F665A|nr:crotonase/enoyl-CoA hydratase family protein [Frankia sp. Mgl5]MCK9926304.1 crotonase/enoyl-CoA hydratase family protein [Frankia sp. Mgl5]
MSQVLAEQVLVEQDGPVLTITLNRPRRRNALTLTSLRLLADAWVRADEEPDVRVIVVTGAGGTFCSGMDLRAMAGDSDEREEDRAETGRRFAADPDLAYKGLLKTSRPRKPVVAAVEGSAIAGGAELLLATDIRVAAEDARFGLSEVRWSLYPNGGGVVRLPRQVPYTVAADLLLTGRHMSAPEALRTGLVGHVVPAGETLTKALEIAGVIAQNGPLAVEAVLRTLRETAGLSESEAFAHEKPYAEAVFRSEDAKEGPLAFAQKRPAVFQRR